MKPSPFATPEIDLFVLGDSGVQHVTEAFADLLGRPASEIVGRGMQELVHLEDRDDLDQVMHTPTEAAPVESESRFLCGDGSVVYVQWVARPDASGGWGVAATDTADILKLLAERHDLRARLELAIGQTTVAMWDLDTGSGQLSWEAQAADIFGLAADQLPDTTEALISRSCAEDRPALSRAFVTLVETGAAETPLRMQVGHELRHLSLRGRVLRHRRRATGRAVGLLLDVTAERALEEQLLRMSVSDGLTGVLNRRGFDQLLRAEWKRLSDVGQSLAVIMLDVDRFKSFNDTFGHLVGDQALIAIARALRRASGDHAARLARYGGEEFTLVVADASTDEATELGERLRRAVAEVALRQAPDWGFTVSVGVAARDSPLLDRRCTDLLARADQALYVAKGAGRDRVVCR